jgi:hypothetical protein
MNDDSDITPIDIIRTLSSFHIIHRMALCFLSRCQTEAMSPYLHTLADRLLTYRGTGSIDTRTPNPAGD